LLTESVKTQVSLDPVPQNGQFMTDTRQLSGAIIDCHVHLYDCFEINDFLTGANRNLRLAGRELKSSEAPMPILMLTEAGRENGFERLKSLARGLQKSERESNSEWKVRLLPADKAAVIATNRSDQELLIISGRQIISSEGLEVLALATDQEFADDYPLKELVHEIRAMNAIPVIPWGVGKWLGQRGRVLKKFLASDVNHEFFLGDILGRPIFWPRSSIFELAASQGICVLPGTDPLPLKSETERAGMCGIHVEHPICLSCPSESLKEALRRSEIVMQPFLRRETAWRFFRNQIQLRLQ
jgi:hypothetical protein